MTSAPFEHGDHAVEVLRRIVAEAGSDALSRPQLLASLLADYLPDAPRVARVFVTAADERVAEALRERAAQGMDASTAAGLTAASFAAATMLAPEVCAWVVQSFAVVLGLAADVGQPQPAYPPAQPAYPPAQPAYPPTPPAAVGSAVGPTSATGPISPAAWPVADAPTMAAGGVIPPAPGYYGPAVMRRRSRRGWLAAAAVVLVGAGLVVWAPWHGAQAPQPVSAGRLLGAWTVPAQVTNTGSTTFTSKKWTDHWHFAPDCASGPCPVRLSGTFDGWAFTATLTRAGAAYRGSTVMTKLDSCGHQPITSTLRFRVEVTAAANVGSTWQATRWSGSVRVIDPRVTTSSSNCSPSQWIAAVSGGR